jgi:Rieske 2Fe-2S family protein
MDMDAEPRPTPTPMPSRRTLPARYYTDPAYFRRELERFYGAHWFCVGRAERVPDRGDYIRFEIGDESLIVLRDGRGALRSFFNVCRHRGTRLCETEEGTFAGTISCPYHAWCYDLDGHLIGAPHMDGVEGFRKEDHPLHPVHVEEWDGHIFLNLAPDPAPLAAMLHDLPERFRPWGMGDLRRGAQVVYDVGANWKSIIQNYSECLHCPIIHPAFQRLSHHLSGVNDPPRSAVLGGYMGLRDGVETLAIDGRRIRAYLPGLGPDERRRVYFFAILPNLLLSLHPDYMMTHLLRPLACDRTEITCEWSFHPDEMARPGFDPDDAVRFWDVVNREDWHVCELSQLGMKSRAYRPGPYSDREGLLHDFDRLIVEGEDEGLKAGKDSPGLVT